MNRPLRGIKVIDLTRLLPGPFATMILGDLGADIVKVEAPVGGDYARYYQPFVANMGAVFASVNRNKRSVALDLKKAEGVEVLRTLLAGADILLESFRPGVMERLDLSYETLRADFPQLIICGVSGYGQTGAARLAAGHDINYAARAGILSVTGTQEGPVIPGVQIGDLAGGALYAVAGVLAALVQQSRGGGGSVVDVSMTHGAASLMIPLLTQHLLDGKEPTTKSELLNGGIPAYNIYPTKDGRHMAVGALEPKFWTRFCAAIGFPFPDDGLASGARGQEIFEQLKTLFATRSQQEWVAALEGVDCCVSPVQSASEVLSDPVFDGMYFELKKGESAIPQLATPLTGADRTWFRPPPALGEHTDEVLSEVGVSDDEMQRLRRAGAFG